MSKTTTKKPKKKAISSSMIEKAILISQRVDLKEVRLIESQCLQTPNAEEKPQILNIESQVESSFVKDRHCVLVFPTFSLTGRPEKYPDDNPAIRITARFLLYYHLSDTTGVTKRPVEVFGEINGVYNAWPYWREFVQNTIARMGLEKLVLPVFRLSHPDEFSSRKAKNKTS